MKSMSKWQLRLMKFMQGRYMRVDTLNKHLVILSFVLMGVNIFFRARVVQLLIALIFIALYYRMFSRQVYKRAAEERKYAIAFGRVKKPVVRRLQQFKERKAFKFYKCSNCKQKIRVPKNRGKIRIKCPKCGNQFEKTT